MKEQKLGVIDLEKLANHRGSAFGDIGLEDQPTQQQFENNLSSEWQSTDKNHPIFIESESRRIGKLVIPKEIWNQMSSGLYLKLNMDMNRRIKNLINDYGSHPKDTIEERIHRISKKLGGQQTKIAVELLHENKLTDLCELLLNNYYDKMYDTAYENRVSSKKILKISDETEDQIIRRILENHG